ncbi:hypothetical protein LSG31_05125 [Fodinisporobacter ferrooxydans]|uniref:Uncharacterized protein n=1 Tax=Fodinisporobacter ferrooxydans TaxID=2901836 RepID=A0ABY4CMW9_9BACL|nr:hypothetical protein LSG31_05125 [Alicyclobacillaceae bacterium MYW30-H2]
MEANAHTRRDVSYRLQKLERKLKTLDPTQPTYSLERELLQKEIKLMKGELPVVPNSNTNRNTTAAKVSKSSNGRLQNTKSRRKQARKGNSKAVVPIIPKSQVTQILSKDPVSAITNIRTFCKQCLRYIQQADKMIDTLFVTTNSLNQSGVLQKLIKEKGKNLNTEDLTNILMALMNSPAGSDFLKKAGDNNQEQPPQQAT